MTQIKERRSESRPIPTAMMQAVSGVSTWKLNVMFIVGLAGMAGLVYWFTFGDRGHDHSMSEFIVSGVMFGVCAFFAFPLGITRLADKFWPDAWRKDRRT